jgi:hypothetical protein
LLEFGPDGKYLREIGHNLYAWSYAHAVRVDKNDNIWITDVTCNTVMKLSPSGDVLMTLGTKGKTGTWDEAAGAHVFNQPTDVGFGPTGVSSVHMATSSSAMDTSIPASRPDKNGDWVKSFGEPGTKPDSSIHRTVLPLMPRATSTSPIEETSESRCSIPMENSRAINPDAGSSDKAVDGPIQ